MKEKLKRILTKRNVIIICLCIAILLLTAFTAVAAINGYVISSTSKRILSPEDAASLKDVDCILVLGCYVRPDGSPSHMLSDRITMGVELYHLKAAPKIIMSGDHGRVEYNEVRAMKESAINSDVPSCDVFMDHAGFSTYESIYRAKEIFGAEKIIIVSQEYHLYRAINIADALGVEAYGVASDYRSYSGQTMRDIREVAARVKDFFSGIIKPEPKYLGENIPLDNGDVTNDY